LNEVFEPHLLVAAAPDTMKPKHQELKLAKPKYTMGRSLEADLRIKDVNVSRRHAEFAWTRPGGWAVTNHSDNGVWVNGAKVLKGCCRALVLGDLVVLSDLRQLYSWTLALPGAPRPKGEPPAKRRRLAEGAGGAGDVTHRHMVAKMEAWRAAAASKLEAVRSAAAAAEREGMRKQEELEGERRRLLERLERQAAEGAAREEEARGALERRLQGSKEEQEEERGRLEERLRRERGEAEEDRRKQVQLMEARIEEEKEKLKKEVEERDKIVARLKTEKLEMEKKFEVDKIKMENELKQLQTQLEENKLDGETKEKMYKEKVEEINMRMEAELLEEKEKHAKEVAEQKEVLEKEAKEREEEREQEREEHAVQLVAMREEQSRREEEVRLKSLALEQKRREQEEVEARVEEQRRELERRQKEDEAGDAPGRAAVEAALEAERAKVAGELEAARRQAAQLEQEKEEGRRELLGRLETTLDSQYQCPTCLELFISPVSLNCGHTYCWLCLAQWRKESHRTRGDLGCCPSCRAQVQHENRVFAIDQMIEALLEQLGEEKRVARAKAVAERQEKERVFKKGFHRRLHHHLPGHRDQGSLLRPRQRV